MFAGAHNDRVGSQEDLVSLVRERPLFPQGFRHHAEHRSAIQQIGAIRQDGKVEIAERGVATNQVVAHGVSTAGGMRYIRK